MMENFGIALAGGLVKDQVVKTGTKLPWMEGIAGWDNERSLENDVFEVNVDNKTLTMKRDGMLEFNGMFTFQLSGDGGEKVYVYLNLLVNGQRKKRLSGMGGTMVWRNDLGFSYRGTLHKGDVIELEVETNWTTKKFNALGVDFIHIQELGKESWFWE